MGFNLEEYTRKMDKENASQAADVVRSVANDCTAKRLAQDMAGKPVGESLTYTSFSVLVYRAMRTILGIGAGVMTPNQTAIAPAFHMVFITDDEIVGYRPVSRESFVVPTPQIRDGHYLIHDIAKTETEEIMSRDRGLCFSGRL